MSKDTLYEVTIVKFEYQKGTGDLAGAVPLAHIHLTFSELLLDDNPDRVLDMFKKQVLKLREKQ